MGITRGRDPKTLRYGIPEGFIRYLEDYVAANPEADRLVPAAKRLLALPKGEIPRFEHDREGADLWSNYQFERDLEASERPISERWGSSPRRLSCRFMARLEEARFKMTWKQKEELTVAAGWTKASGDKLALLLRDGRCGSDLEVEQTKVRALAVLLEYTEDPFDVSGDTPARYA